MLTCLFEQKLKRVARFVSVLIILSCSVGDYAQTPEQTVPPAVDNKLNRPLPKTKSYANKPLHQVVEDALFFSQVPGGVAYLPKEQNELLFNASLANPTYRDVFNAIVAADPRYKWEVTDGTINFVPVNNYPELLNTTISEFKAEDAHNIQLLSALEQLPELQQRARELGFCTADCPKPASAARLSSATLISIHCENMTLRDILNSMVRANGNAVWAYSEETRDGKKFFHLNFTSW
jgi:hypothetical protein